jgi:hypothetical protein
MIRSIHIHVFITEQTTASVRQLCDVKNIFHEYFNITACSTFLEYLPKLERLHVVRENSPLTV